MKIEKLRNNHKKEIIIGTILTIVIGGALTFRLTHSKYRVTQSIDLGSGVINYTAPDFKIMAIKLSEDGSSYNDSEVIPTGGYVINEEKTYCKTSSGNEVKGRIKTVNGIHGLYNINKGDKCFLFFDKKTSIDNVDDLIAKVQSEAKTTAPNFSQIATNDEGVYSTTDGMYDNKTTYYWRGAAKTNHIIFAEKCWRIVRINGDKTVRLIYNGTPTSGTCADFGSGAVVYSSTESDRYYATNNAADGNASYVGWTYSLGSQRTLAGTPSNAKTQTEQWYSDTSKGNLKAYESKIADGKFCNDRDTESGNPSDWHATGSSFNYAGRKRLQTNNPPTPTFNCPTGDVYTLKVGAITADEVAFAGGVSGQYNGSYYLKGDNHYWTMSPSYWENPGYAVPGYTHVFVVYSDGNFSNYFVYYAYGLRPVINLNSDVTFSSGNGEQNSPYIVQ